MQTKKLYHIIPISLIILPIICNAYKCLVNEERKCIIYLLLLQLQVRPEIPNVKCTCQGIYVILEWNISS